MRWSCINQVRGEEEKSRHARSGDNTLPPFHDFLPLSTSAYLDAAAAASSESASLVDPHRCQARSGRQALLMQRPLFNLLHPLHHVGRLSASSMSSGHQKYRTGSLLGRSGACMNLCWHRLVFKIKILTEMCQMPPRSGCHPFIQFFNLARRTERWKNRTEKFNNFVFLC